MSLRNCYWIKELDNQKHLIHQLISKLSKNIFDAKKQNPKADAAKLESEIDRLGFWRVEKKRNGVYI